MQDAWRAYLELAMGLTEAPRKKAQDAVKRVVGQGGATAGQLQSLAEELVATGLANREALTKLVRFEVDRALGAVGLATADEVAELTRRVHDLERQLREARTAPEPAGSSARSESAPPAGGAPSTATASALADSASAEETPTKAVAKKTVAKKAIARKPAATVVRTSADPSPVVPGGGPPAEPTDRSSTGSPRPAKKATGRRAAGS
ncbi:phasin family protein [Micromonospora sp. NBS 11-29]|uniref:phasin family protein n=1 Tax=Micromonospora sp. NBS 11-29 TaxID=1960879 RepID=UPI000B76C02E|nr:hypothetical protein [Micromonospora sp. NBS 11-29]